MNLKDAPPQGAGVGGLRSSLSPLGGWKCDPEKDQSCQGLSSEDLPYPTPKLETRDQTRHI